MKAYLTVEQAISILPEGEYVHTFYNPDFGLVGADIKRDELIDKLRKSDYIELTGEQAKSMKHGLCAYNKTMQNHSDILFIETDSECLEKLEKDIMAQKTNCDDGQNNKSAET